MFRKDFCEINLLRKLIANGMEWPNVIINTTTPKEQRADIKGTLSIFSSNNGAGHYTADKHTVKVTEDTFFISNEHQNYSIDIDQPTNTETFNIHFSTNMLRQLQPVLANKTELLLDNRDATGDEVNFFNKLYWKDDVFRNTTRLLKEKADNGELNDMITDELLSSLLEHIYIQQVGVVNNLNQLSVAKRTTKEEVRDRLNIATDYIHSMYHTAISLDELATVACLSKFHFLRLFKQVFQQTPYQYITKVRLQKAAELLMNTTLQVNDVALAVGYEDGSTFSRSFKRYYNEWPQAFRLQLQK